MNVLVGIDDFGDNNRLSINSLSDNDLIYAFSELPRDLNFIQHTSRLGWKMNKRGKPIIIDPGLYSLNKSEIWWVSNQRSLPTSFKLFTGKKSSLIFYVHSFRFRNLLRLRIDLS
ncbi:hypothetical protein AXX17_AT3G03050 [Arabidopsis thaliana]|uniref:Uncharacterized protein n=1 Tax=Arabidopsis thaliana TaxID=3702 RepID=A0A178VE72_ARATH|nr:hypothetical protein AXX17_AT3G03050 [Arabidopsis thaliana]